MSEETTELKPGPTDRDVVGMALTEDGSVTVPSPGQTTLHEVLQADADIQRLCEEAARLSVESKETLGASSDLLKDLKLKRAEVNDRRKKEKAPSLAECRRIDRKYKVPTDLLSSSIETLTESVGVYYNRLKREAAAAQLTDDMELREATAKALADAERTGAEPDLPTPKVRAKAPKRIETGVSSTTILEQPKWRLAEVEQGKEATIRRDDPRVGNLDDRFFVVDTAELERAIRAGEHVPNVEKYTRVRTMSR